MSSTAKNSVWRSSHNISLSVGSKMVSSFVVLGRVVLTEVYHGYS